MVKNIPVEIEELAIDAGTLKDRKKKLQLLAEDFCNSESVSKNLCYITDFRKFCWYDEENNYWKLINDDEYFFYHQIKNNKLINITRALLKDFIFNVAFHCKKRRKDYYSDYISIKDTLLNTMTFEQTDFDMDKWAFYKFNISNEQLKNIDNPLPDNSRFKIFLDEIMIGENGQTDNELINLLQEMFGYSIADTIKSEVVFFLKGDRGANGKGTIISLLQKILGSDFCTTTNLKTLSKNQFALSSLVGKKINISEENEGEAIDSSVLKTLVSGDEVRIEGKFRDSFSARLKVTYIFTTNLMPKFTNFDTALKRRMVIIPFDRSFAKEERDLDLKEKLANEIDSISLWALQGLKNLVNKNFSFSIPEYSATLLDEELQENNSCIQFYYEKYAPDDFGPGIKINDLYYAYVQWCKDTGRKAVSMQRLGKDYKKFLQADSFIGWDKEEQKSTRLYHFKVK